jgi:hypothetical protein
MSEIHARAVEAVGTLSACLYELAETSGDMTASNTARAYARRLSGASSEQAESLVSELRAALATKSDLTDGVDQPEEYWMAFERVSAAAKAAGNWLVALRRPELVHVAWRQDEA